MLGRVTGAWHVHEARSREIEPPRDFLNSYGSVEVALSFSPLGLDCVTAESVNSSSCTVAGRSDPSEWVLGTNSYA